MLLVNFIAVFIGTEVLVCHVNVVISSLFIAVFIGTEVLVCHVHPSVNTVGSRFTTGLRSCTFGCKSSRRKTSTV